jgi:spore coat polysaccharide biosynthesis protein SpsF
VEERINMKILAIIQARVGSTRLPKKVLLPLGKKTVLENVYDRVSAAKLVNHVLIATTTNSSDDEIINLCQKKGMDFFRGSEEDLLDRYYQAAKEKSAEHIVRITADCPLVDPRLIDKVIKKHLEENNDYTATAFTGNETFPDGEDVDIFTFASLKEAWEKAKLPYQREHATQYFVKNADDFKISNISYKKDLSDKRWTLDEPNDYLFLKSIYKALEKPDYVFGMEDILEFLGKNPEIEKINDHIARNEGLKKSLNQSDQ